MQDNSKTFIGIDYSLKNDDRVKFKGFAGAQSPNMNGALPNGWWTSKKIYSFKYYYNNTFAIIDINMNIIWI